MEQRIQRYENQENTFVPIRKLRARLIPVMMRVAAVLVIAVGAWFILQQETTPEIHTIAADAKLDEAVVLPDGTHIYLNQEVNFPITMILIRAAEASTLKAKLILK